MKLWRVRLVVMLLLSGCSLMAWAQSSGTGSIEGTVQDNTPAVIPGATITVASSSGVKETATTNEKGEYVIRLLPPGTYSVSISMPGFNDFHAAGVSVTVGNTTRADATLLAAGISTKIDVSATQSGIQVETESSQMAGTITSEEITTIGLNGRNFTQLVALAPGVSNQTGQDEAVVGVKGSVNYSVNGGRVEYNSYDVDGGDVLNASINGSSSTLIVYPSLDAIGDMQVLTSNYGAMYGRSASGTILATTKSGGATFHGDAYFFVRNNIFNARNFFDQTAHAPLYQKYDPGVTFGGPLYIPGHYNTSKDKTFFFVSEEYHHDREPVEYNQGVPSLAERNCALAANPNSYCGNPSPNDHTFGYADFSDVCPSVSPGIGGVTAGGQATFTRVPDPFDHTIPVYPDCPGHPVGVLARAVTFPGNLVPVDPRSQAILNTGLIPAPNSASGCNSSINSCYNAVVSPLTTWREDLFRIDHNFTQTEKIYFRYIHDAWSTVVTTPQWGLIHNSFPTVENNFVGPGTSMVAHFNSTISNKLVNDASIAYTTDHISITNIPGQGVTSLQPPALITAAPCIGVGSASCGIGYIFNNGFGGKIPGIVVAGTNAAYGGKGFAVDSGYMPWHHSNPTYSLREDATLVFRTHTFQFGALGIIAQRNEVNPPVAANTGDLQGIATFSNVNTRNSSGNAFADFLMPNIQTYQQDSGQSVYHNNYMILEPYVQDDWKVTRRLTLNLGLRVSLFGLYHEKYLQSYNWVASQYSSALASQVSVQQSSGVLLYSGTSNPVPLNLNNVDPHLLNGVVRCGVDKYANGQSVPGACMTNHLFNPAPRVGFAWDPFGNGKTSIRAGYGLFFEHGTGNESNTGALEGSPGNVSTGGVLSMTQYYPNSWNCIGNAAAGCSGVATGAAFPLNLTSIPTRVNWPYVQQWSLSVQRELPWDTIASLAYVGSRGSHLTAALQINQLVPVNPSQNPFVPGQPMNTDACSATTINGQPISPSQSWYPNYVAACSGNNALLPVPDALRQPGAAIAPGLGQIYSLENVASSHYNALQITLHHAKGPLTFGVSYSYSHSIDDASDRNSTAFVNAYNLAQNTASSDFDQRHLLNINYIYQLSLLKWYRGFMSTGDDDPDNVVSLHHRSGSSGTAKTLLEGWELSGLMIYSTGTPFSVLNGGGGASGNSVPDNAGVAAVIGPGSYPDLATNVAALPPGNGNIAGTIGPLIGNPGQFIAPQGLTYGDAGRNALNNPSRLNFDTSLFKSWKVGESKSLQFRLETFNTFNHTQFRIYDPSNPGNTGNNVITCYGGSSSSSPYSAGAASCLAGSSFLHPVDAHRPRTIQLGLKLMF